MGRGLKKLNKIKQLQRRRSSLLPSGATRCLFDIYVAWEGSGAGKSDVDVAGFNRGEKA